MNSKILVATHKKYNFPDNSLYQPIHVGKSLSKHNFGYLSDDNNDNISHKNRNFCELTALYWAWKNNYFKPYKYVGLVHYRRYFTGDLPFGRFSILSDSEIEKYLDRYDVILPKKRKYYIETIENHYANAHNKKDLDTLRDILLEKHPEYIDSYSKVMKQRELYLFNMFVTKKELYNEYMEWIFDILFELEKRVNITQYDQYQSRVYGFISERLLNVWLLKNQLKTKELKMINIEGENLTLKAFGLIKRKFSS